MNNIKSYEDLLVWQKSHKFVLEIYRHTKVFPKDERFGLVQQLRRAASSVATNIAEGFARHSKKEYIRFLYVSRASLSETEYHLYLSRDLNYLSLEVHKRLKIQIIEIGKMLNGSIKSLKKCSF